MVVGPRWGCCYWNGFYRYVGTPTGVTSAGSASKGVYYPHYWGYASGNGGDFNGDGRQEIVIATPAGWDPTSGYVDVATADDSSVSVVSTLSNPLGYVGGEFGDAVTTRSDADGDGYSDLVVGAPGENDVFVYYGAPTGLPATPELHLLGTGRFGDGLVR